MSDKKVLILIERLGIGGVETHVDSIAAALAGDYDFLLRAMMATTLIFTRKILKKLLF